MQHLRVTQRPPMAKVQAWRAHHEEKSPPGKRQAELSNQQETPRDIQVQMQLTRLQIEPIIQDERQTKCDEPAEIRQLEGDSHGNGKERCVEEDMLHIKLCNMQDMLIKKQKENEDMCKKLLEMKHQVEEISSLRPQMGDTDLEKHRDLLVSENRRLRQELQHLRSELDNESSQELEAMRQRLLHLEHEEAERKALISTLQHEVQQKAERLAEAELRVRDSIRMKRAACMMRRYETCSVYDVQYVLKTIEVESGAMKAALGQAEDRSLHLQKQLDRQNQVVQDVKKQLQHEQQETSKLHAQVALYATELERAQEQMVEEFRSLQEEKELAVSEAFERAQEEMRAVHQSLDDFSSDFCAEAMNFLETCKALMFFVAPNLSGQCFLLGVRRNLLMLQPALRTLTHDYNVLKRQVRDFPGLVYKVMREAQDEFSRGVKSVEDTNAELLSKYRQELYLRKECHNQLVRLRGNIRVLVRVRPITSDDGTGPGAQNILTFDQDDDGILHITNKGKRQSFELDKVFPPSTTQEEVFDEVSPLITSCLDGYNVCILAYGQTGSGKTYSMEGTASNPGINQRALRLLLSEVSKRSRSWEYHLSVSMAEIYNETLRDLLGSDCHSSLDIKMAPGGAGELYVPGLTQRSVRNMLDINKILDLGRKQRATEHTNLNTHSSRSHALLILSVKGRETSTGVGTTALRSQQAYIPYRNSKLTYLLQEALSRDGKALLLLQVAPVEQNMNESLCSLRFGDRIRSVELGVPTRKTEQLRATGTESSESDSPSSRGARPSSVRKKLPVSVRQRIGPP
ncbi:unnamed protein product [Ranitomeya imitator]|uniref:Kinesin motor domain-containing protein n=1 Tax=Ranitomeya imitator TaxID=111125 RepID=A0ABN9MIX6_9NEOB|nr:unnamed protein product [Ranitomeya imitator]